MTRERQELEEDALQRQRSLARWDNEGGAGACGAQVEGIELGEHRSQNASRIQPVINVLPLHIVDRTVRHSDLGVVGDGVE